MGILDVPSQALKKLAERLGLPTTGKTEAQLAQSVASYASNRRVLTGDTPFLASPRVITNGPTFIGYDAVADTAYMVSTTQLYRSTDGGKTYSSNLTLPSGVTNGFTVPQIIRAGGYLWCWGRHEATQIHGIYRAAVTTGNTALTWSAALLSLPNTSATGFATTLSADAQYVYATEYGLPSVTNGPRVYRLPLSDAAGTAWETVLGPLTGVTHAHGIAPDPYAPGHVWLTLGDGIDQCIYRSTNYGAAGSWVAMNNNKLQQSVQISFGNPANGADQDVIYLAPDATPSSPLLVISRQSGKIAHGSYMHHSHIAVPAPGSFMANTTNGSTSVTTYLSYNNFTAADIGRKITGPGIPDGATITAVPNSTTLTISAAATATATNVSLAVDRQEQWNANNFWGAVDPATGIYYYMTNDNSSGSTVPYPRFGLFAIPYVGGPVIYVDTLYADAKGVLIGGGRVYVGRTSRKLLAATQPGTALT